MDIEQINPRNEAALRAWWQVGHDATADRPGKPWPLWEQSRVSLPAPNPERDVTLLAAIDGREMVGAGMAILPSAEGVAMLAAMPATRMANAKPEVAERDSVFIGVPEVVVRGRRCRRSPVTEAAASLHRRLLAGVV